jgi:hypothetical protein
MKRHKVRRCLLYGLNGQRKRADDAYRGTARTSSVLLWNERYNGAGNCETKHYNQDPGESLHVFLLNEKIGDSLALGPTTTILIA